MSGSGRRHTRAPATTGDVAEFLRHLTDDRWLGAHPYARDLRARLHANDDAPAASAAVLRSNALLVIGRLREQPVNGDRLHAIVSRCDVGGELHKSVAAELGLSRRQFYRDLAFARGLVDRDVRAPPFGDARPYRPATLIAAPSGICCPACGIGACRPLPFRATVADGG